MTIYIFNRVVYKMVEGDDIAIIDIVTIKIKKYLS